MLWHASSEPQRHMPCSGVGVATIGRSDSKTASEKPTLGRRRT
jgi:hypothetical protein